jgi:hypothetical protein
MIFIIIYDGLSSHLRKSVGSSNSGGSFGICIQILLRVDVEYILFEWNFGVIAMPPAACQGPSSKVFFVVPDKFVSLEGQDSQVLSSVFWLGLFYENLKDNISFPLVKEV